MSIRYKIKVNLHFEILNKINKVQEPSCLKMYINNYDSKDLDDTCVKTPKSDKTKI